MRPHRAGFVLITVLVVCASRPARPMESVPFSRAGRSPDPPLLKKGVVVVTTTRAGSGRITPRRGPDAAQPAQSVTDPLTPVERARRIAGEDLSPVKARVLLMLALTAPAILPRFSGCSSNTDALRGEPIACPGRRGSACLTRREDGR